MKAILAALILKTSILGDQISGAQNLEKRDLREQMQRKITIEANGEIFVATLANTAAAEEFSQILPIWLDMSEYGAKEKTAPLAGKFSGERTAPGRIKVGDLMIYGQNTLVLFHKSFEENFYEYVKIAEIDDASGLKQVLGSGDVRVKFKPYLK